jgi:hypothetical protein
MEVIVRKIDHHAVEKTRKLQAALEVLREARLELEAENDATAPLPNQLYHWHKIRQYHEAVKEIAVEAEKLSRRLSYEQLPLAFRSDVAVPVSTVILPRVGRFTLSHRTTAKVLDWPRANDWLWAQGHGDAVREMVPAATMNSLVGELLKQGEEPPREAIEANTYAYTSFTKD